MNLTTDNADCGLCGYSCQTVTSSTCQASACACPSNVPTACGMDLGLETWTATSTSSHAVLGVAQNPPPNYQAFTYRDQSTDMYGVNQTFTYTAIAARSGTYTVTWNYTGFHAYYQAKAGLNAFTTNASSLQTVQTLVPFQPASGGFNYSGTVQLALTQGQPYGFTAIGTNFDSNDVLQGTITLTTQLACTDLTSDSANCGACGNACGTNSVCASSTCLACGGALPPGSYINSCSNCTYDNACNLACQCQDVNGVYQSTTLGPCAIGIGNLNGVLTCCGNC